MQIKWKDHYKVPVKSWCENIEESAMNQVDNLASLPFIYHHLAIMPDCHSGYGMPVGGVLATKNVIIPYAIGVDIGCGMHSIMTNIKMTSLSKGDLIDIINDIKERIPVGFNHRKIPVDIKYMPRITSLDQKNQDYIVIDEYENARYQLGTLGGGNHFIEIQKDHYDYLWVMIHSGSRNLGKKVCDFYHNLATEINTSYYSIVPKEHQLAFFPLNSLEGIRYSQEMNFCLDFAKANRECMAQEIIDILHKHLSVFQVINKYDVHHNYATLENHFGQNVVVHRKGATAARENQVGIIPGSQGTASYIVRGKGNQDSFKSCSHGSGRKMSRTKAEETLDLVTEIKKLDDQGIIHGITSKENLDEAAGAYKDIEDVMKQQEDLVEILVKLTPLGVIKG